MVSRSHLNLAITHFGTHSVAEKDQREEGPNEHDYTKHDDTTDRGNAAPGLRGVAEDAEAEWLSRVPSALG